jgi:hypothetical protein
MSNSDKNVSEIWNKVYICDPSFFGDDASYFGLESYKEFKKHGVKKYWSWDVGKVEIQSFLLAMI